MQVLRSDIQAKHICLGTELTKVYTLIAGNCHFGVNDSSFGMSVLQRLRLLPQQSRKYKLPFTRDAQLQ